MSLLLLFDASCVELNSFIFSSIITAFELELLLFKMLVFEAVLTSSPPL